MELLSVEKEATKNAENQEAIKFIILGYARCCHLFYLFKSFIKEKQHIVVYGILCDKVRHYNDVYCKLITKNAETLQKYVFFALSHLIELRKDEHAAKKATVTHADKLRDALRSMEKFLENTENLEFKFWGYVSISTCYNSYEILKEYQANKSIIDFSAAVQNSRKAKKLAPQLADNVLLKIYISALLWHQEIEFFQHTENCRETLAKTHYKLAANNQKQKQQTDTQLMSLLQKTRSSNTRDESKDKTIRLAKHICKNYDNFSKDIQLNVLKIENLNLNITNFNGATFSGIKLSFETLNAAALTIIFFIQKITAALEYYPYRSLYKSVINDDWKVLKNLLTIQNLCHLDLQLILNLKLKLDGQTPRQSTLQDQAANNTALAELSKKLIELEQIKLIFDKRVENYNQEYKLKESYIAFLFQQKKQSHKKISPSQDNYKKQFTEAHDFISNGNPENALLIYQTLIDMASDKPNDNLTISMHTDFFL